MGKAIHTHKMIRDGDHVMVAVSGGKDSVALLWLLSERIKRIPIEYRITAVHVDPGFGANSAGQMESFFLGNGGPWAGEPRKPVLSLLPSEKKIAFRIGC